MSHGEKMDRCRTICNGKRKSGPRTTLIIVGLCWVQNGFKGAC